MAHTLTIQGWSQSGLYNLPKVNNIAKTDSDSPITLKSGDIIEVPTDRASVTINGTSYVSQAVTLNLTDQDITIAASGPERTLETYNYVIINYSERKSVDLAALSGWANLSSGSHTIKIVAKGTGYRDSEKSAGVEVTKGVPVTYDNVTLGKVDYQGQTQGTLVYNQIANADKTKYYIIVTGSDSNNLYYYGYLAWDNTKSIWGVHSIYNPNDNGDGCKVVGDKSNETSIVFGFGDVGVYFSSWSDTAVCVSSTTEPDSTTDYATIFSTYPKQSASYWTCFIEGTLVTLADGTKKPVEDIAYNDDILCWDFYKGKLTSAKPAWITTVHIADCYNLCKFSNRAEVGFVGMGGTDGYHRIYNDEAKAFTHTGVAETPIGTTTFAEDGTFPKLVKQQIVKKDVKFYNIGTEKHFNLFTNGILTSSRISNMYAIKDMKYYGERLISDDEISAYIEAKRNY
nr:MAG TPA: ataxin-1 binding protein [Caudoviricetes sp.]